MKKIDIRSLKENAVSLFDDKWCLITAGDMSCCNTMTASWGAMGELWNRDVCFCFIRPQRYTYDFVEKNELFTLSFFPEKYRAALTLCGRKSGRDCDKIKEAGLTPKELEGSVTFEESEITLVLKKIAYQDISPDGFLDKDIDLKCYPQKDYHRMYVGQVIGCYVK